MQFFKFSICKIFIVQYIVYHRLVKRHGQFKRILLIFVIADLFECFVCAFYSRKRDIAVAAGLGAAGILAVNKVRGFHRRATYGSDQPAYNTTPVYYSQTSY